MNKKLTIMFICLFIIICIISGVISFMVMNTHRVFIGTHGVTTYIFNITPSSITLQYNINYVLAEKSYMHFKSDDKPKYIKIKLSKQDRKEISDMIKEIKRTNSFDKPHEVIIGATEIPIHIVYAEIQNKYYISIASNTPYSDFPEYHNKDLLKLSDKLVLLVLDYLKCDAADDDSNSIYRQLKYELG